VSPNQSPAKPPPSYHFTDSCENAPSRHSAINQTCSAQQHLHPPRRPNHRHPKHGCRRYWSCKGRRGSFEVSICLTVKLGILFSLMCVWIVMRSTSARRPMRITMSNRRRGKSQSNPPSDRRSRAAGRVPLNMQHIIETKDLDCGDGC